MLDKQNLNQGRRWHIRVRTSLECQLGDLPTRCSIIDMGVYGVRVYSAERFSIGEVMDCTLFLADGMNLQCSAYVVWWKALPQGSPADYELGLQFVKLASETMYQLNAQIRKHLKEAPSEMRLRN